MPYTLKTQQISVKDPDTGEYSGVDILTEQTEQGLIAEIQAEGASQINDIETAGASTISLVEDTVSDAQAAIAAAQATVDELETEKNAIAATVASMAGLGTDKTLSTPAMAADAKATGAVKAALADVEGEVFKEVSETKTLTVLGKLASKEVNSTGIGSASSTYYVHGYLLKNISQFKITPSALSSASQYYAFFDASTLAACDSSTMIGTPVNFPSNNVEITVDVPTRNCMFVVSGGSVSPSGTTTKTFVSIVADVSQLKSALNGVMKNDYSAIPFTLSEGYIKYDDGTVVSSTATNHTDYVDVSAYATLKFKRKGTANGTAPDGMVFYDAYKGHIPGSGLLTLVSQPSTGYLSEMAVIEVPQNAVYARFSAFANAATYGNFELYGKAIISNDIQGLSAEFDEMVADKYGVYTSPNLIVSDSSLTSGYVAKAGSIGSNSGYVYTDYIPVSPNDVLRVYSVKQGVFYTESFRFMCCYNSSKAVMSDAGSNDDTATFTVPSGVAYVRATTYAGGSREKYMLTANKVMTAYEPYGSSYHIEEDFLTEETTKIINRVNTTRFACALPQTRVYQTVGLDEKWYSQSMVTPPGNHVFVSIGQAYCSESDEGVSFPNTTALSSDNGYTFVWMNAFMNWIKYGDAGTGYGWSRRIVAENLSDCSLLAIGDSTVDHDVMTASMLSHFAEQGQTLTLLGTLGSGTNKNEGRAGWKASDYLTNKQYDGVVNPFYNPITQTFDFSYYMTNQSYTGVDFVVLQLGINDLYFDSTDAVIEGTWASIKVMIDSILAYDNSIKIILNLPTTPNANQSEFIIPEFLYRNKVIRYNEYAMSHALAEYGTSKVRCSYCHLILNPETEIRDNVHPTDAGYGKMALEVINQINCWQNGQ